MATKHTDQIRAEALAALVANGGNVKATARQLGINRLTLTMWRDKSNAIDVFNTIPLATAQSRIDLWDRTQTLAAERIQALLPLSTELRDVAFAARVAVDAYQDLAHGRKGLTVNIDQSQRVQNILEAIIQIKEAGQLPEMTDGNDSQQA